MKSDCTKIKVSSLTLYRLGGSQRWVWSTLLMFGLFLGLVDLKELVTRLQEENARLQSSTASSSSSLSGSGMQSDFTFSLPSSSSSSRGLSSSSNDGPVSYSESDILSFLSSAPTSEQISQPFTMIEPASFPPLGDDWLWNSSTFGTEIPQAIPPSVDFLDSHLRQNINDNHIDSANANSFVSATTTTNPYTGLSTALLQSSKERSPSSIHAVNNYQDPAAVYTALLSGHSPGSFSAFASAGTQMSNNRVATNITSKNTNTTLNHGKLAVTRAGSHHSAESPDTTCSSSGSDPSDHQPSTPSSVPLFSTVAHHHTAKSNSHGNQQINNGYTYNTVSPPSNIFDAMNYRDPVLSGLDTYEGDTTSSLKEGIVNGGDPLDFNDFLVQSPPSFTLVDNHSRSDGNVNRANSYEQSVSGDGGSRSSIHTLGSSSSPTSSSAPQTPPFGSSASLPTPPTTTTTTTTTTATTDLLPYDVGYDHPLIVHIFGQPGKDIVTQRKSKPSNEEDFCDIDGLCDDMKMKASCKEVSNRHS